MAAWFLLTRRVVIALLFLRAAVGFGFAIAFCLPLCLGLTVRLRPPLRIGARPRFRLAAVTFAFFAVTRLPRITFGTFSTFASFCFTRVAFTRFTCFAIRAFSIVSFTRLASVTLGAFPGRGFVCFPCASR